MGRNAFKTPDEKLTIVLSTLLARAVTGPDEPASAPCQATWDTRRKA